MGNNNDSEAIVRAVTGLCGSLGVTATAEGVETGQQLDMLRNAHCEEIQGFLVSQPRPANEVKRMIEGFERTDFANV